MSAGRSAPAATPPPPRCRPAGSGAARPDSFRNRDLGLALQTTSTVVDEGLPPLGPRPAQVPAPPRSSPRNPARLLARLRRPEPTARRREGIDLLQRPRPTASPAPPASTPTAIVRLRPARRIALTPLVTEWGAGPRGERGPAQRPASLRTSPRRRRPLSASVAPLGTIPIPLLLHAVHN